MGKDIQRGTRSAQRQLAALEEAVRIKSLTGMKGEAADVNDRGQGMGKTVTGYWHFDYQTWHSALGLHRENRWHYDYQVSAFQLPIIGISITTYWHFNYQRTRSSLYSCASAAAEKNVKKYLKLTLKGEGSDDPSQNGFKILPRKK